MSESVKVTVPAKKPTLKDIAKLAGLSVPTVSQILNNKANNFCSEEKKELVRQIARQLNYMPNFGYQVMTGKKTNTIGLVSSDEYIWHDDHIRRLLLYLSAELAKHGNATYIATLSINSNVDNLTAICDLINRGCSAFIFIGTPLQFKDIEHFLNERNINFISYSRHMSRQVIVDNSKVYKSYIEKFQTEDRHNFKIFLNENTSRQDDLRMQGVIQAFPELNYQELSRKYIIELPNLINCKLLREEQIFTDGYNAAKKAWQADKTVRGMIFLSDYYALGAAKYFGEIGVKVGTDIALCGYNNTDAVKFAQVPISTAGHQLDEVYNLLLKYLPGKQPVDVRIDAKIILK